MTQYNVTLHIATGKALNVVNVTVDAADPVSAYETASELINPNFEIVDNTVEPIVEVREFGGFYTNAAIEEMRDALIAEFDELQKKDFEAWTKADYIREATIEQKLLDLEDARTAYDAGTRDKF